MSNKVVRGTLSAAVTNGGTFTVSYPPPAAPQVGSTDEGSFYLAMGHKLVLGQNNELAFPVKFNITLGTGDITVTNASGATWAAGTSFMLQLEEPGKEVYTDAMPPGTGNRMARMVRADMMEIMLGAADALVTNAVMAQQNRTNAGALLVNGTLAVDGVVTLDVPRNVIADSGGADTAVLTVTGKDEYGATMSEALTLNGTTAVAGKKAFKQITAISASAAVANTAFIGTGDVLGLPVFVPSLGHVVSQLENGTAASAGTFVAGIRTSGGSTTTTGDVRGTYDPNSAADGDKTFQLLVALPDPGDRGIPQA